MRSLLICFALAIAPAAHAQLMPQLDGQPWTIAHSPDLGALTSEKQQPVDFAIWQAADKSWQLCSCIRATKTPGKTRLLFRWEGKNLTDTDWKPQGIFMQADPTLGETQGGLQAPFVVREADQFFMFYGDWENICLAISGDGKVFNRRIFPNGKTGMFSQGLDTNTRDPMVIRIGELWHCYYTAYPDRKGAVFCRTSKDFSQWSEPKTVAAGGEAGDGPFSAECPFVVQIDSDFYLFRTQKYGSEAATRVYHSRDPLDFGVDHDEGHLLSKLDVAAPEIFQRDGQRYIAFLRADLKGIQLAKLKWAARN